MKCNYCLMIILLFVAGLWGIGGNAELSAQEVNKVILRTAKGVDEAYWSYKLKAEEADKAGVWIDWNNDGIKTEEETSVDFGWGGAHAVVSQTIAIYGKITLLEVTNMKLERAEFSSSSSLKTVNLKSNNLKEVDLRALSSLEVLDLSENGLTQLQLGNLSKLSKLTLSKNNLSAVNLKGASALTACTIMNNPGLATLDLSDCSALETIDLMDCALTELKLAPAPKLKRLYCHRNKIKALNLKGVSALEELWCFDNNLSELDFSDCAALTCAKIYLNRIEGSVMRRVVVTLPDRRSNTGGELYLIDIEEGTTENNEIFKPDAAAAKAKNWKVYARLNRFEDKEYAGSDEPEDPSALYTTEQSKMSLTQGGDATSWRLALEIDDIDVKRAWIDWNNDGKYQKGEEFVDSQKTVQHTASGNSIMIYGKFTSLDCSSNNLVEVSVRQNKNLKTLKCNDNQLISLNLTDATALRNVYMYSNRVGITEIDNFVASLEYIFDEPGGMLYFADMSSGTKDGNVAYKQHIAAIKNKGWSVFARVNGDRFEPMKGMIDPNAPQPGYTTENGVIILTRGASNGIWNIAVNGTSADVNTIWIDWNNDGEYTEGEEVKDPEIPFTRATNTSTLRIYGRVSSLDCVGNNLTDLDISKNPVLVSLNCSENKLAKLNLEKNTKLVNLYCVSNLLQRLDLSALSDLMVLNLDKNGLRELDVAHNPKIKELRCAHNALERLNLSNLVGLEEVYCYFNNLQSLVLPLSKKLITVSCYHNKLKELDFADLRALEVVVCDENQLSTLDFSTNINLEYASIYSNQIDGDTMNELLQTLPRRNQDKQEKGQIIVVDTKDASEKNHCYTYSVTLLRSRHWEVYDNKGRRNNGFNIYDGEIRTSVASVSEGQWSVYPNPVCDRLTLVGQDGTPLGRVLLFSSDGACVGSWFTDKAEEQIDFSTFDSGVYVLSIGGKIFKLQVK